jgi:hypothetical protein
MAGFADDRKLKFSVALHGDAPSHRPPISFGQRN